VIPAAAIKIEPAAAVRGAKLDQQKIEEYAASYSAGDALPPVVVFEDPAGDRWLADGLHRLRARARLGLVDVDADVRYGTRADAEWYASGANVCHGLPLTREQRREAIRLALRARPDASDRQIAEHVHCSHHTVAVIRTEESTGQNAQLRTGKDGKVRKLPAPKHPEVPPGETCICGEEGPDLSEVARQIPEDLRRPGLSPPAQPQPYKPILPGPGDLLAGKPLLPAQPPQPGLGVLDHLEDEVVVEVPPAAPDPPRIDPLPAAPGIPTSPPPGWRTGDPLPPQPEHGRWRWAWRNGEPIAAPPLVVQVPPLDPARLEAEIHRLRGALNAAEQQITAAHLVLGTDPGETTLPDGLRTVKDQLDGDQKHRTLAAAVKGYALHLQDLSDRATPTVASVEDAIRVLTADAAGLAVQDEAAGITRGLESYYGWSLVLKAYDKARAQARGAAKPTPKKKRK